MKVTDCAALHCMGDAWQVARLPVPLEEGALKES